MPELEEDHKYCLCLFARKKYAKDTDVDIPSGTCLLKRFIATKNNMLEKIHHLEIEKGRYYSKGVSLPQEALSLYVSVNPRDMQKALKLNAKKLVDMLCDQAKGFNIHQEALSCIQKSKGLTCWIDFDIDYKEFNLNILEDILDKGSYRILETRGGFHILVDPKKVITHKRTFYKNLAVYADKTEDNLIPVPGCVQGDFVPRFL